MKRLGPFTLSTHDSVAAFSEDSWRACVGLDQPFLDWRHFKALEQSGMIGEAAGSVPHYLSLNDADGNVTAIAPVFLKTHSRGELGIDWGMPLAHERVSGPYFPKLMVEVPLTPWPGRRLMGAKGQNPDIVRDALLSGLDRLAKDTGARSVQIGYATQEDQAAAVIHGYIPVETTTFTWRSRGEQSFEDFKAGLAKKGRQRVRKEYEDLVADGLEIKCLDGHELTPEIVSMFYRKYCAVFEQHNHAEWLSRDYFDQVVATMPDALEFLGVWESDQLIAGLLCFRGEKTITAQHWVTSDPRRGLLFALMYHSYRSAIERGYTAVDYGSIGGHKTYRAALPNPLFHALKFTDAAFQSVAETVLRKRRAAVQAEFVAFTKQSPYKDKRPAE